MYSVGKRLLIAVIAIAAITVAVLIVSEPKEGSVEWHKGKYLVAWKRANGEDWRCRVVAFARKRNLRAADFLLPSFAEITSLDEEASLHRDALVRLGYLVEKDIAFSIGAPDVLGIVDTIQPRTEDEWLTYFTRSPLDTNAVRVFAPRANPKVWEKYFQKRGLRRVGQ